MDIVRLKEIVEDIKGRTGEDDMTIDNNTITKLGNIRKVDLKSLQKKWLLFTKKDSNTVYGNGWQHDSVQLLSETPDWELIHGTKFRKSNERDYLIKLILDTKEQNPGCKILNTNLGIFSEIF